MLCIRCCCHEIRLYRSHLWSGSESSGRKVVKKYGSYHLMAMGRIHSSLAASIMRAITSV